MMINKLTRLGEEDTEKTQISLFDQPYAAVMGSKQQKFLD